ncbi:MAG: aminotransferase class V-fold PLP-dependent enzyme, partial [Oscillospiraceae bacterium]|nr:aminotransferase class V-fold PLP-dependent enzyme [Oscillospiraceae bacterium]
MEKRFVYVDNAATTPISKEVLDTMMPWLTEGYGNASSIYSKGREAGWALKKAHEDAAAAIGTEPNEVYFTSCGSESDNWALKGAMQTLAKKGKKHIITSVFEHHAILHTCNALEKQGFEVTYLPVYENGIVKPEDVEAAIRPDTGLVTIMFANNEIGTIQPIAEIGKICREHKVWFHTDAVQAMGHVKIDVNELNVDMLSLSGHKIHAQKGVGLLYVRKGVVLANLIDGGG